MTHKFLLAGIDPGTTTGVALLGLDGEIKKLYSKRNYGSNDLIKDLSDFGLVFTISTDKKNSPSFVKNISVKIGANLITPNHDLLVKEKKELVKKYDVKFSNDHEMDALASAIYAYNKLDPLITKLQKALDSVTSEDKKNKIKNLVLRKDNLAINLAIDIVTNPDNEDNKVLKKRIENKKIDNELLTLHAKIKNLESENSLLKSTNKKLNNKLKNLSKKKPIKKEQNQDTIIKKKDNIISQNNSVIKLQKLKINKLKNQIVSILKAIRKSEDLIIFKKINLNKSLDKFIKKKDNIFISDLDKIKSKDKKSLSRAKLILYQKGTKEKMAKTDYILYDKVPKIFENRFVIIIKKQDIDKYFQNKNILENVINEYKNSRKD